MLEGDLFRFLEGTADAAFTMTELGEISSWNTAAEKLFGYPAAEVLHKRCYEFLDGRGALGTPVCSSDIAPWQCGETIPNFDLEVKVRSGARLWVNISIVKFEDSRTHHRLVVHLARDISEWKKSEKLQDEMLQISRRLLSVSENLQRSAPVSPLSEQEQNILRLFASGKNAGKVARELGITVQTLRNHLHHINQKLRTHNRLEAVTHALRRKLI